MGKNKKQNTKIATKVRKALARYLYANLLSFVVMIATIVGVPYGFGRYHMEAQKDKEIAEKERLHNIELIEREDKHREELNALELKLNAMEKERYEWREKYFILLNASNRPANNSP